MRLRIVAFTLEGAELAARLAKRFLDEGEHCLVFAPERLAGLGVLPLQHSLPGWTAQAFQQADGILFVSACGIAVRAIAPYLCGKDKDPAVVVIDQRARFAISLLSGHLGGANTLALRAAAFCGAQPVITTATDVCGLFAADAWAVKYNLALPDVECIKAVSGRLLAGEPVGISCDFAMDKPPKGFTAEACGVGISVSLDDEKRPFSKTLRLIPRIAYLGVGCRKNVPMEALEAVALPLLREARVSLMAVAAVCTIDLKAKEAGLLSFCEKYGIPIRTYSAEKLMAVPGEFSSSPFVAKITGADNVCERAAMAGCGKGRLACLKTTGNGVAVALAVQEWKAVFEGF